MCKKTFKIHLPVIISAILLVTGLFSCGKKKDASSGIDMPHFEQKFPQKTVWVHSDYNDSTAITFSSMEEAEWKLMHNVTHHDFHDAFVQVLLSDPSSMDYPFDSLSGEHFCGIFPPVVSDDGNVRFIGLEPDAAHQVPHMIVQYKNNGKVEFAEEGFPSDNCYYCLSPDTIFAFPTGSSTLYFVWGYNGYTGSGDSYRLCAFELDSTGLHPAFVFEEKGVFSGWEEAGQSLYTEICMNDEMFSDLFEYDFLPLVRFDSNESAIYIRIYTYKEADEFGCTSEMTEFYRKFVWNGKKFVFKGTV